MYLNKLNMILVQVRLHPETSDIFVACCESFLEPDVLCGSMCKGAST
jgi:hypothetical protein